MGCAPSIGAADDSRDDYKAPQPIPYHIGPGILSHLDSRNIIIFIFGGPGSQKGLVTEELIEHYNFTLINIEDIVLNYLPAKVADDVSSTADIQNLLKNDTGVLSLDWLFSVIMAKISSSVHRRFIVDIVPTLASLLRAESFFSDDHDRCLENFEKLNPVMFAMELRVAGLRALLNENSKNDKSKNGEKNDKLSPEMSAFLKGIDEADKGRLERRLDAYQRCAKPFLSYFSQSARIVRFEVSPVCGERPLLLALQECLLSLRFSHSTPHRRVVLFATSEMELECVDVAYYNMKKIRLSNILRMHDNDSMAMQLLAVQNWIQKRKKAGGRSDNFAVILDCLNTSRMAEAKRTAFVEETTNYLDDFITINKPGTKPYMRTKLNLHAIWLSSEGEQLLFVESFPLRLAKIVGHLWLARPSSERNIDHLRKNSLKLMCDPRVRKRTNAALDFGGKYSTP